MHLSMAEYKTADSALAQFFESGQLDDYSLDRDHEIRSLLRGHPDQQDIIHAIACAFFAQFMRSQQIDDLNSAVTRVEEVLQDCPADHPNRFQFLCSLASALRVRFDQLKQMEDLKKAANCSQEALDLCADDHPGRLQALYNLANVTQALFAKSKRDADLDETIRLYRATIEIAPEDDPCLSWSYHNLAIAYYQRSDDLDSCIEANEHALKLRPKGHVDRGASLRKFGEVLVTRYNARPAREDDLDRAITMYQEVLELKPFSDPDDLFCLADALWLRFERLDNADDIERVVGLRRECLIHFPIQHPLHATMVRSLREAVVARGKRLETITDLNEGVTLSEDLLGYTKFIPRETSLILLARALESRWKLERNAEDLEKSIILYQDALQLCFPNHPIRASCLLSFAHALHERYMRSKNKEDLEQAIALQCEATIPLRLSNPESVGNLGIFLAARFELFYQRDDINKSIQHLTEAIKLCSAAVPRAYWGYVKARAHAYLLRFERYADADDLRAAVAEYRSARKLQPNRLSAARQGSLLHNLATTICTQYHYLRNLDDLQEAIQLYYDALRLIPIDQDVHSTCLTSLANAFWDRFIRLGNPDDLTETINLHQQVLQSRQEGHPERPFSLVNLAGALHTRFQVSGRLDEEEDSIKLYRDAVDICPVGHPRRAWALNNLATALHFRFIQLEEINDLDDAIHLGTEALQLYPKDSPERALAIHNLASGFFLRFEILGGTADFGQGLRLFTEARGALSDSEPISIRNLSRGFLARFKRFEDAGDLKQSIDLGYEAIQALPEDHPERLEAAHHLANVLALRSRQSEQTRDLEEAIRLTSQSLEKLPQGHPHRSLYRQSIAGYHLTHFQMSSDRSQLMSGIKSFTMAVVDIDRPPRLRLADAIEWLTRVESCASFDDEQHAALLEAYKCTIQLLPRVAYFGLDIGARLKILKRSERLASDGAIHALILSQPEQAVEMLEDGRAVFWSQALRLKTPFDDLPQSLSQSLRDVSIQLEADSYRKRIGDPDVPRTARSMEEEAARRRRLSEKFEDLIEEARSHHGFERFLRGEGIAALTKVAQKGFVVLLVANEKSCRAITIRPSGTTEAILLPSLTLQRAEELGRSLNNVNMEFKVDEQESGRYSERIGSKAASKQFIRELWFTIIKPVLQSLNIPV
jgi:hypothetical protein